MTELTTYHLARYRPSCQSSAVQNRFEMMSTTLKDTLVTVGIYVTRHAIKFYDGKLDSRLFPEWGADTPPND